MRTQWNRGPLETSGSSCRSAVRSSPIRSREGTPESSANETWIPFPASSPATDAMSRAGACTITPRRAASVVTWTSSWTCSSLSATAVTSSVDIIHEPSSASSSQLGRQRRQAQPPARDRLHPPRRLQHDVDGRRAAPRRRRRRRSPAVGAVVVGEARLHMLAQLVGVVGQAQQVERGHRARVQARVADRQAVGDDRRARRPGLQAGDAAGRVHEHVGGGQDLGHLVGEAVDAHPRFAREQRRAASPPAGSLRPARQTMLPTSGTCVNSRTAPAMSPTPQPPPETTTMRPSSGGRAPARGDGAAGLEELGGDQRAHELHAAAARRCARPTCIDSPYITRCMSMPRLRPEEQAGQIGDRGDRRAVDLADAPQPRRARP